ncbi:hypothetical protein HQ48_06905 [Porphyromonas sp. COT-290 OH3588]|nr:hypothetical protein HQ48_06905 [Porphyromonas sp. COT-290 OH3588]
MPAHTQQIAQKNEAKSAKQAEKTEKKPLYIIRYRGNTQVDIKKFPINSSQNQPISPNKRIYILAQFSEC